MEKQRNWRRECVDADKRENILGYARACMKKRMLLPFVEQLGLDHEALMENAIVETEEDDIADPDPSALLLASKEIRGH